MDWLATWGVAMGAAWLSGIRLYAGVLTLGLLQRFGYARLPGDLRVLGEWWVIAAAGVLFLVEFLADKIPAVDSAWDAVHTFIRAPAGAILAAAAFANVDHRVQLVALLLGGSVALTAHGTKAATRLAVNTSPEPFSNIAVSLLEDAGGIALSWMVAYHPVVMLCLVAVFVAAGLLMLRTLMRGIRRLFGAGKN